METTATHSLLEKTQPDAHFTKVIDGKEIIVNVFFSSATETMQQKIERMLRMDIFNKLKEMD